MSLLLLVLYGNAVLPSRKSDQEISKSDFYQTIFLPKIRPKADPNLQFLGQNKTCSQNLITTIGKATFIQKYFIFKEMFKYFFCCDMWKADKLKIWLFGPFWPKSGLFRQKEDQFRSTFFQKVCYQTKVWKSGPTWQHCNVDIKRGHNSQFFGEITIKASPPMYSIIERININSLLFMVFQERTLTFVYHNYIYPPLSPPIPHRCTLTRRGKAGAPHSLRLLLIWLLRQGHQITISPLLVNLCRASFSSLSTRTYWLD